MTAIAAEAAEVFPLGIQLTVCTTCGAALGSGDEHKANHKRFHEALGELSKQVRDQKAQS